MPVPKRKHSRARRDKRSANKGMSASPVSYCPNCREALPSHSACPACGHYKGKKVFVSKSERAIKRGEARKAKQKKSAPEQPAEASGE